MINNIKRNIAVLSLAIFGSVLLINCEPEVDSLGEQLFLDGAAQGNEKSFPLIAFNIDNKDSIQSDASKLDYAVIGAFDEGQFGMQKASYVTQLRLSQYNPDFGTNPIVDSVVMVMKPLYASDSLTTTTNEDYIYPDGNVAAKKVVNTYPAKKFGKTNTSKLTFKVHEVTEFLNGVGDFAQSNKVYTLNSQELGSKEFNGKVNSVAITKDADGSSIFSSDAGFRIPLSATFFQNKIIDMKGKPELNDASNFIRHFNGLRLSVLENDGYLMKFAPNTMQLIMYYKKDKTENGVTTKVQANYAFDLGSRNVHVGQYEYNRDSSVLKTALANINTTTGDSRLYAQGMGGPSMGVKISAETINELKSNFQTKKAAIIGAKIRVYLDDLNWKNKYYKPSLFTILQHDIVDSKPKLTFTADMLKLAGASTFKLYSAYDLDKDKTYYEFTVTQSVKELVEEGKDNTNKYFKIDLADYIRNSSTGAYSGAKFTNRAYSTDRAVFIGTDANNVNNIQLKVIYGTK